MNGRFWALAVMLLMAAAPLTIAAYGAPSADADEMYMIYYNTDGGVNNPENPSYYYSDSGEDIILKDPTKQGMHFKGWFDEKGNQVTKIPAGSTGDVLIMAKWVFYIDYYDNGTIVSTGEIEGGMRFEMPVLDPTGDDKKFGGWMDGNTLYKPGDMHPAITKDTSLTSHWLSKYTMTFQDGDRSVITTITDFETMPVDPPANPTKQGYTFLRWAPEEIPATMPSWDTFYTALWSVNPDGDPDPSDGSGSMIYMAAGAIIVAIVAGIAAAAARRQ